MVIVNDNMRNGKSYNGNTLKFGITVENIDYIVKLPKEALSVYTEYLASKFIRILGVSCHMVALGEYNNMLVNVIKDFTSNSNLTLHSYKDTKQSSEDTDISVKHYTYKDITYLIEKHLKMTPEDKSVALNQFWNMFICDAILANRDRHWGNWGYLSNGRSYKIAPIYDNGASLFPNVDRVIKSYVSVEHREEFLRERVFKFPASLFMIERPDRCYRTNYYEMFSDLRINHIFANRVRYFREHVSNAQVFKYAYNMCFNDKDLVDLDFAYKRFYVQIITLRYMCIINREDFHKSYMLVESWLESTFNRIQKLGH